MEYFVPAWHEQYDDWSISIPTIGNFDAISHMRILQNNNREVGLIVSDYQPQLTTRLNQLSYHPDKLFSVYDYLQNINTLENRIVELNDFNWPKNAVLDFTPFRTLIVDQNKLIARILYDLEGKILRIEHKGINENENYTLVMDSRGFISSKITNQETIYLDPYGDWRFKQEHSSGKVKINTDMHFCKKEEYDSLEELVNEVIKEYLVTHLRKEDHLIVTLDDQSTVPINLFVPFKSTFLINQKEPYHRKLATLQTGTLLVNEEKLAEKIKKQYPNHFDIHIIPTYNSEFRLGHSLREKVQEIAFFAENADNNEIDTIVHQLCKYVSKDYKNKSIRIYTYSPDKDNVVNQVIDNIKKESKGKWIIGKNKDYIENDAISGLEKEASLPQIDIASMRLTNISQLLKSLDKTRILINWGKANELMQIAAISIGIPQIQNFVSTTVVHQKNGYICQDTSEISKILDKYLDDLKSWNNALIYNVKMLNQYSEKNIMKRWKKLLGDK